MAGENAGFKPPALSDKAVNPVRLEAAGTAASASVWLAVEPGASVVKRSPTPRVEAATAKLFTTESAVWLCDRAVQIHGGYGFIKEFPVEKLYRDVKLMTIGEGTSEVQKMVIARNLFDA